MRTHAIKRAVAGFVALVLGTGLAVSSGLAAGAATTVPDDKCIVDVIKHDAVAAVTHDEFRYKKVTPAHTETFHNEYKYSRTATIYTVEHKDILYTGSSSQVLTWLNANGTAKGGGVWTLSDAVVNAAGVNPFAAGIYYDGPFDPDHDVNLSFYNGNAFSQMVQYRITSVDWGLTVPATPFHSSHSVTLYYTGAGDGSVNSTDAIYVATAPGAPWSQFGAAKSVSNNDGTLGSTVFYVKGGAPTTIIGATNWTTDTLATVQALDPAWTFVDTQNIIDSAAVAAYDENVYGSCPIKPCTSQSSTWFTEAGDVAPTFTSSGLKFSGPNVPAVDYLHLVSGNLQGVIGTSYTISSASGYHAALVYEIFRNGTTDFATISIEPYNNNWVPGQTGVFTVTNTTKVWTSKITSGLGSQAMPATIDQMSAIFPNNALIAQGIHLGTNSAVGQFTVVSKVAGCGDVNFLAPPTVSCLANANTAGTALVLPAIPGVSWKVNGGAATPGPVTIPLASTDVTVQAVPTSSAYQFGPGVTTWKFDAGPDGLCQEPTLAQFPTNVTHTDQVCVDGKLKAGTITVGVVGGTSFFTGQVDYFLAGSVTRMTQQTVTVAPGTYALTALPADPDDTLEGLKSWSVTVLGASGVCGDLTTLALTGASSPAPWALLGLMLLVAGTTTVAVRAVRRRGAVAE